MNSLLGLVQFMFGTNLMEGQSVKPLDAIASCLTRKYNLTAKGD